MEKAAQDAGLIPKNVNDKDLSAALFKLMENGKLLTKDVLPAFGVRLRQLARGDIKDFNSMLGNTFSVNLGRATNNLKVLSDQIFKGGVRDGIMFLFKGFNSAAKESKGLAQGLGGFLGGALVGLLTPIRLVTAAILDLKHLLTSTFDITEEGEAKFLRMAGAVVGAVGALTAGIFAAKKVRDLLRKDQGGPDIGDVISESKRGGNKTEGLITRRGHSPAKPLFVAVVNDIMDVDGSKKKKPSTKTTKTSKPSKFSTSKGMLPKVIGGAATIGMGVSMIKDFPLIDIRSAESVDKSMLPQNFPVAPGLKDMFAELSKAFSSQKPVQLNIDVKPSEEFGPIIRAEATSTQEGFIQRAFDSMAGGE